MQRLAIYILSLLLFLFTACEDTTFRSSVPYYPVSLKIDTNQDIYVNFKPACITSYVVADKDGYHFNGITRMYSGMGFAYGYAGVVIYITLGSEYMAYDLCCPHCLLQHKPVDVDGMFATCPTCGEEYNLDVYGTPTKGISREALRRYSTLYSNGVLTIRN